MDLPHIQPPILGVVLTTPERITMRLHLADVMSGLYHVAASLHCPPLPKGNVYQAGLRVDGQMSSHRVILVGEACQTSFSLSGVVEFTGAPMTIEVIEFGGLYAPTSDSWSLYAIRC